MLVAVSAAQAAFAQSHGQRHPALLAHASFYQKNILQMVTLASDGPVSPSRWCSWEVAMITVSTPSRTQNLRYACHATWPQNTANRKEALQPKDTISFFTSALMRGSWSVAVDQATFSTPSGGVNCQQSCWARKSYCSMFKRKRCSILFRTQEASQYCLDLNLGNIYYREHFCLAVFYVPALWPCLYWAHLSIIRFTAPVLTPKPMPLIFATGCQHWPQSNTFQGPKTPYISFYGTSLTPTLSLRAPKLAWIQAPACWAAVFTSDANP